MELTKKYSGTGLGLAISKGLTELLGGKIWLDTSYQDGAKFIFTIPYHQIDYFMHTEPITDADKKRYNWEGRSILIAEDDDCNYQLLEILLQQTNASIIRAKTGKEAVSIFSGDHDFSVVLMDIQLPELNGYEATRAILKINPRIPVIAQTAYAMSEDRSKAMEAGCIDYIAKPIRKNQLFNLLDRYLQ